jgi:hypothetical protein
MRWLLLLIAAALPADPPYFVRVSDSQTGRGVPLVQLSTALNNVRFWTDSAGIAVIDDPAMQDRDVIFAIKSHGYEFQEHIFDEPARRVHVQPGTHTDLKIRRVNLAERLYRITGEGIYRDTILAGLPAPIEQPLLNGGVTGQDTNIAIPYQGKLFWCYGDTMGLAAALFSVSCASSLLPGKGGLDPDTGVNLTYFVNAQGFSPAWSGSKASSPRMTNRAANACWPLTLVSRDSRPPPSAASPCSTTPKRSSSLWPNFASSAAISRRTRSASRKTA